MLTLSIIVKCTADTRNILPGIWYWRADINGAWYRYTFHHESDWMKKDRDLASGWGLCVLYIGLYYSSWYDLLLMSLNRTREHTSSSTWRSCIRLMVMQSKNCSKSHRSCIMRWKQAHPTSATSRAITATRPWLLTLHPRSVHFDITL